MLTITNLTKKFGDKNVAKQVNITINPGEIFALVGPNGSGKTTIVKIIAGLLQPSEGEVKIGGIDIVAEPEKAKAQIGYIPDEPTIWPYMTGEEFIHLTGALFGVAKDERVKNLPGLLDKFKLQGIEQEYFEEYSRGNKQKFSILAALSHRPKLLLIDEPIVGLDPESAETAKKEFAGFAKSGGAVLLVTHTLNVAEEIADRIGILEKGRLIAVGTMAELRAKAGLEAASTLNDIYKKMVGSTLLES
jgi:ABC-2 type transport system ATP-binding protein